MLKVGLEEEFCAGTSSSIPGNRGLKLRKRLIATKLAMQMAADITASTMAMTQVQNPARTETTKPRNTTVITVPRLDMPRSKMLRPWAKSAICVLLISYQHHVPFSVKEVYDPHHHSQCNRVKDRDKPAEANGSHKESNKLNLRLALPLYLPSENRNRAEYSSFARK